MESSDNNIEKAADKIESEMRTLMDQVADILERYPATRNNDTYLWLMHTREYVNLSVKIPFIPWEEIKALKPESVARARRKINEGGKLMATDPKVIEARARNSEAYRLAMSRI